MAQVAVIGGGPGGVSCAIWLKRLGLEPVLYERGHIGGQLHDISLPIPDLPGEPLITARELIERLKHHLKTWEIPVFEGQEVIAYRDDQILVLKSGQEIYYPHIAYAPGLRIRELDIPGREWITQQSTSEILNMNTDLPILIVGGGDRAFEAAIRLAQAKRPVILIHRRDHFRARPDFQTKVQQLHIPIYVHTHLQSIESVPGALIAHAEQNGHELSFPVSVVMVRIGMEPDIQPGLCPLPISDVVPLWPRAHVRCLGDAVSPVPFRSIVSAYASGMMAAKELVMNLRHHA
ncbi:NAD(P)/FAD-dependent oxidoreductase [Sulfobacillus thermosulfidooxidans]|uniref:NAD(P)/FAD-dependent oxidoreductase n=1 Tax=Sulfobacillus thermosulfidooxidans TaxID=28034 RepID=UPI00096B90D2|nr:NAD(P)/FAD-dependent oxidoreductase [Sulfobacillus thermosulfidooxidans]OLZ11654.1 hypothetical protein BFX05_06545 [Sulfobacillus thermosulfidooxidans]OLZ18617.1 hypothetical protein BFX06_00140 [Sulfobacillus thermosulfidooxidans]OLZ20304.1 hypothetical protein BFX07_01660 [Sulfobacillus thermosulfidooxidans]